MAKKDKSKGVPEGMKCFKKEGGGSLRFKNRIIKPGQIFCIDPEMLPDGFKDTLTETAYVKGCVVVETDGPKKVKEVEQKDAPAVKFDIAKAKDGEEFVRKGNKFLYNVIAVEDGSIVSEKPLTKGAAKELADTMNS